MNVIVANKYKDSLSNLDIDIIKSITGEFEATEIVDMFKNFFYNRMILDVSAIRNFEDIRNFQILSTGLDVDKVIFFLPEGSLVCTANFLAKLVSIGIYNFTTNVDGVKYLLKKPNTYNDVEALTKLNNTAATVVSENVSSNVSSIASSECMIIGFRNATVNAGATSLIYMIKNELNRTYGDNIIAIEVDKHDFQYFNDKNMISVASDNLLSVVKSNQNKSVILVDLNDCRDDSICRDVIYLMEPSVIKINRLVKNRREFLTKLARKKVVLNKCLLSSRDISEFESEAGIRAFYDIPPLNDREKNDILIDFCEKLDLLQEIGSDVNNANSGIFGMFRK